MLPGTPGASRYLCDSAGAAGRAAGDRAQEPPSRNRPARRGAGASRSRSGRRSRRAALSRALCVPQALRDQVRRVPAGHPAHAGGAPRPGLRVPPALLRLRRVQAAAGHGRRVLPHGGQPAGVQGGLRDGQAARSAGGATVTRRVLAPPFSSASGVKASPRGRGGPSPPAPAAKRSLWGGSPGASLQAGRGGRPHPGPGGQGGGTVPRPARRKRAWGLSAASPERSEALNLPIVTPPPNCLPKSPTLGTRPSPRA